MELPPFMRGPSAHNLSISLVDTALTGAISSAVAKHHVPEIREENNTELGEVVVAAAPTVNNGVILRLDPSSSWTITGRSYLSKLTISGEENLRVGSGCRLKFTVNGVEMAPVPGEYTGEIVLDCIPL